MFLINNTGYTVIQSPHLVSFPFCLSVYQLVVYRVVFFCLISFPIDPTLSSGLPKIMTIISWDQRKEGMISDTRSFIVTTDFEVYKFPFYRLRRSIGIWTFERKTFTPYIRGYSISKSHVSFFTTNKFV